ncbi:MAG: HAMP domain-containing histidine kinase [Ruminococcaceae bacterium]|nr:HAMP domain-containing histidine kinase [Oscillospiraceae bacterium]
MIARLRCKFVVITMIIVMSIMLVAFYSNYSIIKSTMYDQSVATLETALRTGKTGDYRTFLIIKDLSGIQQEQGRERVDANELVETALKCDNDIGDIKAKQLRFMKIKVRSGILIAFTSISEELDTLTNMTRFSTVIISCCAFAFLVISIFLAYLTTKPVSESIKKQKQLIADASHELKTPITAILASSDILLSDELSEDKRNWLSGIKTSAEDMSFLVSDMLSLAGTDAKRSKQIMEPLNLSELVVSVCLNYEVLFFETGKSFEYSTEDNIFINGNSNQLKQFIKIFLDNAGKHSDDGAKINVSLKSDQDKAILVFYNTGTPIPSNELHRIFERFYRVDKARNTNTGSGLGLSIAKRIAEAHSTKIGVVSDNSGTYFFTKFKLIKQN